MLFSPPPALLRRASERAARWWVASELRSIHHSVQALLGEVEGDQRKGYISSHERGITGTAVIIN